MLEKPRRRKSPQQRKAEALVNEHRYRFEYRNAAVKLWAKRKKREQRDARHKVRQLAHEVVGWCAGEGSADRFADKARALRGYRKLHKAGVLTLKEVIEHKRTTGRCPVY